MGKSAMRAGRFSRAPSSLMRVSDPRNASFSARVSSAVGVAPAKASSALRRMAFSSGLRPAAASPSASYSPMRSRLSWPKRSFSSRSAKASSGRASGEPASVRMRWTSPVSRLNVGDQRRPLDDRAQPLGRQPSEREDLAREVEAGDLEDLAEQVGADGADDQHRQRSRLVGQSLEYRNDGLLLVGVGERGDFLELIDGEERGRFAGIADAQLFDRLLQRGARIGTQSVGDRLPVARSPDRLRQHFGEANQRRCARADGRQCCPMMFVAADIRQEPGAQQRRFSRTRCADDQHDAGAALHASCVQHFDQFADFRVAAEEDCRVLGFVGKNARPRGSRLVEAVAARDLRGDLLQPVAEVRLAGAVPDLGLDALQLRADQARVVGREDDREDRLPLAARVGDFGEAPLRAKPGGRDYGDHRLAAIERLIEFAFPVLAGADAARLVEIEEDLLEAEPGQPCLDLGGARVVLAGMADEDRGHRSFVSLSVAIVRAANSPVLSATY